MDQIIEISIGAKGLSEAAATLESRIRARFPTSSLLANASWLRVIIGNAPSETRAYKRRFFALRFVFLMVAFVIAAALTFAIYQLNLNYKPASLVDLAQLVESGINDIIFLSLGAYFLFRIEPWIKRRRMLLFLGKLRDLIHVTQLLQMHKDPERVVRPDDRSTAASPDLGDVGTSAFLMGKYLDYCLDMLTLISAVAAFVGRDVTDKQLRDGIWEIEELCSTISAKISNKTLMLFSALVDERRTVLTKYSQPTQSTTQKSTTA